MSPADGAPGYHGNSCCCTSGRCFQTYEEEADGYRQTIEGSIGERIAAYLSTISKCYAR